MSTTNPFAPPKARLQDGYDAGGDLWRDGKMVVLRRGSDFPDRCIKCNQPSVSPRRQTTLIWHHGAWYLLLPLVLLYVVVSILVRRRTVVHIGLCARHQRRVVWGRVVGWGGFLALVAMLVGGAMLRAPGLAVLALLLLLPWAVAAIVVNRQLLAVRIDRETTRMKGFGPAFLASLPELPRR